MNEVIKTIAGRRSVRAYTAEPVSDEHIDILLDAAIASPTGRNTQAWHFTAVTDGGLINRMDKALLEIFLASGSEALKKRASGPDASVFFHAPLLIVISGDPASNWVPVDSGIAAQSICLAAHSLGLGSCIIGGTVPLFNIPELAARFNKELGVPTGYAHQFAVAVGHVAGAYPRKPAGKSKDAVCNYVR